MAKSLQGIDSTLDCKNQYLRSPEASPTRGINLALDADDLQPLVIETIGASLGPNAFSNVAVKVVGGSLLFSVADIDAEALYSTASMTVRLLAKITPRFDLTLIISAIRRDAGSINVQWQAKGVLSAIAQWTGLIKVLIPWGNAISDVTRYSFVLRFDELPDPMPYLARNWSLRHFIAPSPCGAAISVSVVHI